MKMPKVAASTELWGRIVVYLLARLTRNRQTRHLVPIVKPALAALETVAAAADRAERALVEARAYHDGADDDLDGPVTAFHGELFLFVGKHLKSSLYKKCFPNGLVAVTGARIQDEIRLVKTLEGTIAREVRNEEFAKRLLPRITAAREELERQVPLLRAAIEEMATAWSAELAGRHDLRRQYRIIFAELIKLFPENMKKVNSFFRDVGPARKAAAEKAGEEVEAPGGGGA
ncbi:MAG: hypothetical protein QME96_17970 [Myxococcota bacterium]|nr:hypothetical protein [Myxococcota bacterium]